MGKIKKKTLDKSTALKARWERHKAKKNRTFNAIQARHTIKEAIIPNPLTMQQEIQILDHWRL
jgi:hypothetical protein